MHNFSRYPCMDLLEHILQVNPYPLLPFLFCMKMRTFHGRFGDMWFHFRNDWPLRMWPLNSLRRSGNSWTLLRGPCTVTWCWRPTGTYSLWVRITSLSSWDLSLDIFTFSLTCLFGAPTLLGWARSSIESEAKSFIMWHEDFEIALSSFDLPMLWYLEGGSRA